MSNNQPTSHRLRWIALALGLVLGGCAALPPNARVERVDPGAGYRIERELGHTPRNDPETLLLLAFSGGGTRAAALSYGILEALRETRVAIGGNEERLLDQVDVISGVSGGSFTALAYSLHGERLFDTYEARFLKRDVEGELIADLLNPLNWPSLLLGDGNRSSLAARRYDRILFDGATYADLVGNGRPFVLVSATEFSGGARFAFAQSTFDLLCADLSQLRLSVAATASSAVPVAFTPVTLRNWGGTCGLLLPEWIEQRRDWGPSEAILWRRQLDQTVAFQDSKGRPWLHLVDGGVSDNLGLLPYIDLLEAAELRADVGRLLGLGRTRRVAVVVVNALSPGRPRWDASPTGPGLVDTIFQTASVPIDRNSTDSVVLLSGMMERWRLQQEIRALESRIAGAPPPPPPVPLFPIVIDFAAIPDAGEREFFQSLPTSFRLPPETIDRLRAVARKLLATNSEFQRFLRSFDSPRSP
jgi:NTE family protein